MNYMYVNFNIAVINGNDSMTEVEETTDLANFKKQWALKKASSERQHFKIARGEVVAYTVKAPPEFTVFVNAEKDAQKIIRQKAVKEALKNAEAGRLIPGQGVFIGRYEPKDKEGHSLGKIFNVFAAPQDLTDKDDAESQFTYDEAVKRIAGLKRWNGFDGANYANDDELYKALKDDSYNGGWIIPPYELLGGKNGAETPPDTIYANKDKDALKDTFKDKDTFGMARWYWSSTEDPENSSKVWTTNFYNGDKTSDPKNNLHQSCRPVRLVPVVG